MAIYNMTGNDIYVFCKDKGETGREGYIHLIESSGDIHDFLYEVPVKDKVIEFDIKVFRIHGSPETVKFNIDRHKLRNHLKAKSTTGKNQTIIVPKDVYLHLNDQTGFSYPDDEMLDSEMMGTGVYMSLVY